MAGITKIAAMALATGLSASAFGSFLVTENFNSNTDGYWEHQNNTTSPQNYAWSNTDNTGTAVNPPSGSATAAGELGGTIARDSSPANFYGFNVGTLDPDTESFLARGVLRVVGSPGGSSGFYVGFFNGASSYGSGGDPANFMGIGFGDMVNAQAFIFSSTQGRDRSGVDPSIGTNTTVPFSISWAPPPAGGSNKGELTVVLPSGTQLVSYGGDLPNLNPFTHFGIFATSADGGSGEVYLDDLTFSSENQIPEPASIGLLGLGSLIAFRRIRCA